MQINVLNEHASYINKRWTINFITKEVVIVTMGIEKESNIKDRGEEVIKNMIHF
jgi:hypothetical protein